MKIHRAFVENWEKTAIVTKDATPEILLKRKYGGLRLYDIDNTFEGSDPFKVYVIDPFTVKWYGSRDMMCWCVLVRPDEKVTDENKNNWKAFCINHDLNFGIRCFYRKNPGKPTP